ncbi:hybrid sensor histidine kinase/response regulator [Falsiroseomonas tokyonensis]|uniref:histidine kinase n=1 Tax=Falsiroseomonas tokyonensis TaxID=430521 RepID=A0ABV7BQY4_9PROT|nr:ATP-binding protein [Falsiroseomonas tokyonensis]MBU8537228.1 response regulator [Falsiroseomonas tokyonensis]
MPEIHLPTVFVFSAVLSGFLGLAMLWLWTQDRAEPALACWGLARLLGSGGTVLIGARGVMPDWVSIDLANTLICIGFSLHWTGARQFEGRQALPWVMPIGAIAWLAANQVPAFHASIDMRVALMGLVMLVYNGLALRELVRGQRAAPLPSRPLFIMLLTGVTITYLAIAAITLAFAPRPVGNQLPAGFMFGALVFLNVVFLAGGTVLLVALSKEKAAARATAAMAAARDAADHASAHKTRFLSRMSHELRTSLNGVMGLAQALAHDPTMGPTQRLQAVTLEQAGRHLLAILNEVLDISRIEAGRFVALPRPLQLEGFLRTSLAMMQDSAQAKGVTLELQLDPGLPRTVMGDGLRLRQILMNLLANAIRFSPQGSQVTLRVAAAGDQVEFAVTDAGSGVAPAMRPHLFEEFAQGHAAESRTGSGLGLAISAALARALGGSLAHADGPQGRGSCFTLTLPLPATAAEAPAAEGPPMVAPAAPAAALRILVVDDVAANRFVAMALLGPSGHQVIEAESGEAALAMLQTGLLPDLILMDEQMPGLTGSATTARIRALPGPAARLPILALTADALPEQVQAMLQSGFDGHLSKPVERQALLAAVARAGMARQARAMEAADRPA